jgi:hypothetical protein
MKMNLSLGSINGCRACWLAVFLCLGSASANRGDTVEMTNGDHYSGTVLSVSLANVSLRSEVQGLIVLPREKVATIAFSQSNAPANGTNGVPTKLLSNGRLPAVPAAPAPVTKTMSASTHSNLVGQVQSEWLASAGPEATQKFNEMAANLSTGKLTVPEIRRQAQETLTAVEAAKQDFGPEMDDLLESYLSILRAFLQETGTP